MWNKHADMVESADTRGLKPRARTSVRVQIPLSAPTRKAVIVSEQEMRKFLQKLAKQVEREPWHLTRTPTFYVGLEDDDVNVLRRFIET